MPIRGLTDREERFPEIGQIRKGAPKTENAPGRDLTYFRVEIDERETETIATFNRLFGSQPQELPVMLAFNDVDKVWDAWYEAYTAGRLVARADGEFYTYRVNVKTGEVLTKGGERIPFSKDDVVGTWFNKGKNREEAIKCKPVGRLRVVLPDLGRLAYLTVMTTSIHDIINLSGQIQALAMFNQGRIAGIPLILKRRPKEISCPKPDGSRARYTKWMLSLEADPNWVAVSLEAAKTLSLPAGVTGYLPEGTKNISQDQDQDYGGDDDEYDDDIPSTPEFEEGEYAIVENDPYPMPEPVQKKTPLDNNGHKRPYEPLVLRKKIGDLIVYFEDKIVNEGLSSKDTDHITIVTHIEKVWTGKKDAGKNRHAVLNFLTGKASSKDLTGAELLALKHWLKISKNENTGEWIHCKEADSECMKIVEYLLVQQGQQSLAIA